MDNGYTVVFTGRLVAGRDEAQVRVQLAELFKTNDEGVDRLFDKAPVAIKKNIERDTALRYKAAVEKIGVLCEMQFDDVEVTDVDGALTQEQSAVAITAAVSDTPDPNAQQDVDIYSPPEADVAPPMAPGDLVLSEPQRVAVGETWQWTLDSFGSFKDNPGAWIGVLIVWFVIIAALSLIPFLNIATYVLQPMFIGGLMLGCRAQDVGDDFEFRHLFAGFSHNAGKLAALGGLYLASIIVLSLAMVIVGLILFVIFAGGMSGIGALMEGSGSGPPPAGVIAIISALVILGLVGMFVIIAGFVFSPTLLALHDDVEIFDAVKLSIRGCLVNWLPFLVWGIIWTVILIVAAIPLGLGYLVAGPMMMASLYFAYKGVFVRSAS